MKPWWWKPEGAAVTGRNNSGDTYAGPHIPDSQGDIDRGKYRISQHDYHIQQAVCNDNGDGLLTEITGQAILEQLKIIVEKLNA